MKNYLIYLAGPISGLNFEESTDWRQYVMDRLDPAIEGLSPLRKKQYLKNQGDLIGSYEKWPLSTQRGIYARDRFDCHRADVVLVNLLDLATNDNGSQKVSIGTVMEIAWAAQNNTPVVLIMEEGNIHHHPMLMEACPFVIDNLAEALELTEDILRPSKTK